MRRINEAWGILSIRRAGGVRRAATRPPGRRRAAIGAPHDARSIPRSRPPPAPGRPGARPMPRPGPRRAPSVSPARCRCPRDPPPATPAPPPSTFRDSGWAALIVAARLPGAAAGRDRGRAHHALRALAGAGRPGSSGAARRRSSARRRRRAPSATAALEIASRAGEPSRSGRLGSNGSAASVGVVELSAASRRRRRIPCPRAGRRGRIGGPRSASGAAASEVAADVLEDRAAAAGRGHALERRARPCRPRRPSPRAAPAARTGAKTRRSQPAAPSAAWRIGDRRHEAEGAMRPEVRQVGERHREAHRARPRVGAAGAGGDVRRERRHRPPRHRRATRRAESRSSSGWCRFSMPIAPDAFIR